MAAVQPLVRYNAMLGLASVNEDLGEWAKAKETYELVAKEAKDISPILAARAKNRLEILPRLNEPVVFAPEPAPSVNSGAASPLPGLGTTPMPAQSTAPAAGTETSTEAKPEAQPAAAEAE